MATWPASFNSGLVVSGDGATHIVSEGLYDLSEVLTECGTTWEEPAITAGVGYATLGSKYFRFPPWALSGTFVKLWACRLSGAGNSTLRFQDVTSSQFSDEVAYNPAPPGCIGPATLTIPDNTWADTVRQLTAQVKGSGSIGMGAIAYNLQFWRS